MKVELFGLIKETDFDKKRIYNLSKPTFNEKVTDCTKLIEKNSTGFATIIVGDKNYNDNMVTLRVGESLLANCVTFIDNDFDTKHTIYPDFNFFYIKSGGRELEYKIKKLKEDKELYQKVLAIQHHLVQKYKSKNMPRLLSEALYED